MSTSDPNAPLTRRQLRESRLTGATSIVSPEEAEADRQEKAVDSAPVPTPQAPAAPAPVAEPAPAAAEPVAEDVPVADEAPLTRRQVRERSRTDAVPVIDDVPEPAAAEPAAPAPVSAAPSWAPPVPPLPQQPAVPQPVAAQPAVAPLEDEDEDRSAESVDDAPQPVFAMRRTGVPATAEPVIPVPSEQVPAAAVVETPAPVPPEPTTPADDTDDRAVVREGFGRSVLAEEEQAKTPGSFDEILISDSTGSQHVAPSALIFQQSPGVPSLSGPVAATGEILVTGSYDLPKGLGSQGHADGTTDGKDVDVVLVDGELPPTSSPTPIAASAAIGTIKPAGEVIRPPEPEKGNKLMLALTITAGALAVALVAALIVAITTGALS